MRPTADIIRQILVDGSFGSNNSNEWPIYVGFLPDAPNDAICIYDTAGRMDGRVMGSGEQIEHPGIQVRVRGVNYLETQTKATAIAFYLDGLNHVVVEVESDTVFVVQNVSRAGGILSVGVEESDKRRHHFTINATVTLREQT